MSSQTKHTVIKKHRLSPYTWHLSLDFQSLCPFYSLSQPHHVMASLPSPCDNHQSMGGQSERTQCKAKMAVWNSFSYICTKALHSFWSSMQPPQSFLCCLRSPSHHPSIQPNLGLPCTHPPLTLAISTLLQIGKSTHFWKINIFEKTVVFVICIPKSLNMRSEFGNIKECNKYPSALLNIHRWPDVVAKKGICSCFVPITIVHNFLLWTKMHHLDMILFCSNMNRSYLFMVLLHSHVWRITLTQLCLPLLTYYLANRRMVSYLLNGIFKFKKNNL